MAILRVILDSNLYINYLLSPNPAGTAVASVLASAATGIVELILPADVIAELTLVVSERPHLRRRISHAELNALLAEISEIATLVPQLEITPPSVVRDPKDDDLVALALIHAVNFLVTRDKDLLALHEILSVQIVDPGTLLALLRASR